ncbi:hypothetical protein PTKIN_Ptkin07bG0074700 [Pterospermum kingtungense]
MELEEQMYDILLEGNEEDGFIFDKLDGFAREGQIELCLVDIQMVLDRGPWSFDDNLLIIHRMKQEHFERFYPKVLTFYDEKNEIVREWDPKFCAPNQWLRTEDGGNLKDATEGDDGEEASFQELSS